MRVPRQAWVVGLACVLWTAAGGASFASMVVAYLIALGVIWVILWRAPRALEARVSPWALALLTVAALAPAFAALGERGAALAENERLLGWGEHLSDRLALEHIPSMAPPVVVTDRPQRFFVHAPAATRVAWSMNGTERLEATALGHGLFRVDYDPRRDGEATGDHVTLRVDGNAHRRPVERVRPTAHPRWLVTDPARSLAAAVSEETDALLVVDADGFVGSHRTGDRPRALAFVDERRVAVATAEGVTLHDAWDGRRLAHRDLDAPTALTRIEGDGERPFGGALLVAVGGAEPGVLALDEALRPTRVASTAEAPDHLVCQPSACVAALRRAASLLVLDGATRETVPLGRPAVILAAGPAGTVLVATTDYHGGEPHLGNHFVQDQLLTLDLDRRAIVARRPTAWRTPRQAAAGDVDRGLSPMGIDDHQGQRIVAFAGSDEVEVFREGAPTPATIDLSDTPLFAPHGVARLADGTLAVSSPGAGAIGLFRGGSLRTLVRAEDPAELGEAQRLRRRGEHTFYEATRSGVSCQSCHLHGGTDHVLRNIGGRRLAPTLTVEGVADTAPYLRDGSYPRIADLTHLSTTLLGDWLRPERNRGEALEAYVRSLPRELPRLDADDERVRAGLDVFVEAGCPSCHAFPAFTRLGAIPAGALFPDQRSLAPDAILDTPSLLSMGARGPYLADGRAPTLRAVFDEVGRHGDLGAVSDTELDDLLTFLESL